MSDERIEIHCELMISNLIFQAKRPAKDVSERGWWPEGTVKNFSPESPPPAI